MKLNWIHAGCLRANNPAYERYPEAPSIFVFDDEQLRQDQWTLKRIGFVYECLLELRVVIRRGDVVSEVRRYAREVGAEGIVTVAAPDPRVMEQARSLEAEVLPEVPFVELKGRVDLARFSRYWRKAQASLTGG